MWRRPLAYGHATATRIFLGDAVRLTDANHMESISGDPRGSEACERDGRTQQASDSEAELSRRAMPRPRRAFRRVRSREGLVRSADRRGNGTGSTTPRAQLDRADRPRRAQGSAPALPSAFRTNVASRTSPRSDAGTATPSGAHHANGVVAAVERSGLRTTLRGRLCRGAPNRWRPRASIRVSS